MMASPAFSRSTSRRSSISQEDQIHSKILNQDPFEDAQSRSQMYSTDTSAKKYSSHSLPRNFSLKRNSEVQSLAYIEDESHTASAVAQKTDPGNTYQSIEHRSTSNENGEQISPNQICTHGCILSH